MPPDRERDQLRGDRRAHRPVPGLGTDIVRRLVGDGLVLDSGPAESTAGDRAVRQPATREEHPATVIARIAAPGPISYDRGILVRLPNLEGWDNVAISEGLQRLLALPVLVDDDATVTALGACWRMDASAYDSFGLPVHGEAYRGTSWNAGEIGHVVIQPDGVECTCGLRGCLDAYSSPGGMANRMREHLSPAEFPRLGVPRVSQDAVSDFGRMKGAANNGDDIAQQLLLAAARGLSTAAFAVVNLIDLDLLVLTGEAFVGAENVVVDTVAATLTSSAFSPERPPCWVRISPIAASAGAIGAASLRSSHRRRAIRPATNDRQRVRTSHCPSPRAPTRRPKHALHRCQ